MHSRIDSLYIFLFFLFLYLILCSGHIGGDSLYNYFTAENLLTLGTFDLTHMRSDFHVPELQHSYNALYQAATASAEPYYSAYGAGVVGIFVIFYILGSLLSFIVTSVHPEYITVFTISLANCLIVAILDLYFYLFVLTLIKSRRAAFFLTIVFAAGTYMLPYALKGGYLDPTQALCIFAPMYHLYRYNITQGSLHLYSAGFWTGFALLIRFTSVLAYPFFLIYLVAILRRQATEEKRMACWKAVTAFALPVMFGVTVFCLYNYFRFGNVLDQGYVTKLGQNIPFSRWLDFTLINIIARLYVNLLSFGKGLFFYAPILLLSYHGFKQVYSRDRLLFWLLASVSGTFFLFHTVTLVFIGDWAWGLRYLLIILPPVCVAIASLAGSQPQHHSVMRKITFLFLVGLFVQLPAVLMNYSSYIRLLTTIDVNEQKFTTPQLSPILGGYFQLASGVHRSVTGHSLSMPIDYNYCGSDRVFLYSFASDKQRFYLSLEGADNFDLWFVNIWKLTPGNSILQVAVICVVILLLIFLLRSYKHLNRKETSIGNR